MNDTDNSGSDTPDSGSKSDTPGTDQEEINEDARLLGNEPDADAIDEPVTDSEQEARESYWMIKETIAIGLISIVGISLIAFGAMQATGLITLPGWLGNSPFVHWSLFLVLGVVLVLVFAWSQWGTTVGR
ncbi:hypothetical protein [Natronosalvus rutilus]|uniref:Uncharacterized protein n=1 Tax=Natronosalvus rutilus TaxID=2953753 RepID=A0A9E7N642_9EURY|nr:hypothetical protein [Natronosalvus rutilus]UTF52424.1 hypothetical protein NGM29_11550 [Natronosalvus rutilus]